MVQTSALKTEQKERKQMFLPKYCPNKEQRAVVRQIWPLRLSGAKSHKNENLNWPSRRGSVGQKRLFHSSTTSFFSSIVFYLERITIYY